ncbi:MAG: zf-TFIIB domain-containing protein [Lentisphaerae bacterium]|nr:zf-TFIIB domain-containing protein [Lentisphaerota bacterium]
MKALICPGCGAEMTKERDPDIIVDRCLGCRGVFLDRGELDAVATGAAGEIEYGPVDVPFCLDRFPVRECPKCSGQRMEKVNLLRLPDLIFDRCRRCKGFYLDRGECEAMNDALRQQAPNRTAQEFRDHMGGRLVRVDRVDHTESEPVAAEAGRIIASSHVRATVYFRHPLAADVRILQNSLTTLLARLLGLVTGQRITTGIDGFDRVFTVHSADKERVLDLLPQPFVDGMISLAHVKPDIFGRPGQVSLCRASISYCEGPYRPEMLTGMVDKSQSVVERLLRLAEIIDIDEE